MATLTSIYINKPKKNKIIVTLARMASFVFTLKYRIFYRERVKFGKNFITDWRLHISGPGKVIFGDNVHAWARKEPNELYTYDRDAVIQIGSNTRVNGIECHCKKRIEIGDNSLVTGIYIDTDFHSTALDRNNDEAEAKSKPIIIGKNTWVGGRSAILKGVTIGDNSIVGFGSVVTQDVPPNVIVAGNPARVVKQLNK